MTWKNLVPEYVLASSENQPIIREQDKNMLAVMGYLAVNINLLRTCCDEVAHIVSAPEKTVQDMLMYSPTFVTLLRTCHAARAMPINPAADCVTLQAQGFPGLELDTRGYGGWWEICINDVLAWVSQ